MACCQKEKKYGYDDSRFEKDVDEEFHCSVCYNVLKEPRMCRNNEHIFCFDCISEHLKVNSETCPECNEHLSLDTLRKAPRVLRNCLSKVKINCDHASRGCPQFTRLEELRTHVSNCGYAPVLCSNAECGMEINKQDKDYHETEVCEYRRVKCQDCGKMQEVVGKLEGRIMELDRKMEDTKKEVRNAAKNTGDKVEAMNEEMKTASRQIEKEIGEVMKEVGEVKKEVGQVKDDKVEAMNKKVGEVKEEVGEVKEEVGEVKKEVGEVKEEVGEVKTEVEEVKKEVKDVKENLFKVNKDVDEVKVMMSQVLEKLNMLEHLNKLPFPTEEMLNTPREDILIAGGVDDKTGTEIFSWEKNGWFEVSPMNEERAFASSFIYEDQLFVLGGRSTKAIDTLDLSVLPLKWMKFPRELPFKCNGFQTVVCQQTVIHIGGYNCEKRQKSNMISELQLTSPSSCFMKELCQIPEPRQCHSAEVFEDKVLILGGYSDSGAPLDSVLEFDLKRNKCKEMPKLPVPLARMATVRWRQEAVVLGGINEEKGVVNDVFMYNIKTGKITVLPSMLEKRWECYAIITGNTIVVMGGANEKGKHLNTVECFTMGGSTWEYLPAMNKARYNAVGEVLPYGRKYV